MKRWEFWSRICIEEIGLRINHALSFQERARLGMERLSKQAPVTLAMARKQVQMLKAQSKSVIRKQRD